MGKRGPKPKNKVKIKWSPEFAYAIGLLTSDGNLSPDGRHINFTSKDKDLCEIFKTCLGINNKIGRKSRGGSKEKKYYVVQFGSVKLYDFLISIGITPRKSKTIKSISIPPQFIFDFLRGHLDGDGTFYSYWDSRWRSSFMFYTCFTSASKKHIEWLRGTIFNLLEIKGHVTKSKEGITYNLKYAKKESIKLLRKIYYKKDIPLLERKKLKIDKALGIVNIKI